MPVPAATARPRPRRRPSARRRAPPAPTARRGRRAPRRSCGRWWPRSPSVLALERGEVVDDDAAVGVAVEPLADELRRRGEREVDGLAPQFLHRALALRLDLGARPGEKRLLLLLQLRERGL